MQSSSLGGAIRVGHPWDPTLRMLLGSFATGNGFVAKGQGSANGRKMKGTSNGLAFLWRTLTFTLYLPTVCNVTRRLTYSLLYTRHEELYPVEP